jgi:uncharacterized protein with von Willebrand factor type A (vWA) domain
VGATSTLKEKAMMAVSKVDIKKNTELYKAATEALVSDASASSTFEKMIKAGFESEGLEDFLRQVHITEKIVRKEFEIKSMPNPWRSAKSVISSAFKLHLDFKDENKNFLGKTTLQNRIKLAKSSEKSEKTVEEWVKQITAEAFKVPPLLKAEVYRKVGATLSLLT